MLQSLQTNQMQDGYAELISVSRQSSTPENMEEIELLKRTVSFKKKRDDIIPGRTSSYIELDDETRELLQQ